MHRIVQQRQRMLTQLQRRKDLRIDNNMHTSILYSCRLYVSIIPMRLDLQRLFLRLLLFVNSARIIPSLVRLH